MVNKRNKKAQALPLNTIVIAILVIIVMVVIITFFVGNIGKSGDTLNQINSCNNENPALNIKYSSIYSSTNIAPADLATKACPNGGERINLIPSTKNGANPANSDVCCGTLK